MSSKKENFFEKIKNNLMRKYYIQEDSLFKLLYDKYLRPEIFKGILNKSIKNDKDVYEVKCFNLSVIRNENSDNMNDIEIKREMNSLKFFKYQAFVIKGQFFLCSLSALALSTGVLVLLAKSNYKIKRLLQSIFLGLVITIIPLNIILLYSVSSTHPLKKELLDSYKNEIVVYNKFYSLKQILS